MLLSFQIDHCQSLEDVLGLLLAPYEVSTVVFSGAGAVLVRIHDDILRISRVSRGVNVSEVTEVGELLVLRWTRISAEVEGRSSVTVVIVRVEDLTLFVVAGRALALAVAVESATADHSEVTGP